MAKVPTNEILSIGTEYVRTAVAANKLDPVSHVRGSVDPTGLVVEMAFTPVQPDGSMLHPTDADWRAGAWETEVLETVPPASLYWAVCLVGANGTGALIPGRYNVFTRITSPPETPVIPSDTKLIVA